MQWTRTKPDRPGWHWWRTFAIMTGEITYKEILWVDEDGYVQGAGDYVTNLGGEWSDRPLEEPEEA